MHFNTAFDCDTVQSVALFGVHEVEGRPVSSFTAVKGNIFHVVGLYELYFISVIVHDKFQAKV